MHAYRPNHYEALGVPRSADAEAIRTAWRAHAKQLHPDLSEGPSSEAFLRLQEAYDVLRDPERRASYDDTLAREAAMADAARQAALRPPPPRRVPPQRTPSRLPLPIVGLRRFLAASTRSICACTPRSTSLVRMPGSAGRAGRLARGSRSTLTIRIGSGSGEKKSCQTTMPPVTITTSAIATRKRVETQLSELDAHKAPATTTMPAMLAARVQCTGRGTNIVMTRDKDGAKVAYDNGPPVQPRISDLGSGTVLVSRIEPSNKIAIGFTKGDRSATKLLLFDEAGRVLQTFPVDCTAAAF